MAAFDKDILATLTDEERAAIETPDDEIEAQNKPGDDEADTDDDGDDAQADPALAADEPAAEIPAKPAPAAEAKPAAAAEIAADEPAKPAAAQAAPTFTYSLPADHKEQVDGLKDKASGLWAKFDTGDISREELQQSLDALAEDRQRLQNMALKAELAADMQRQQAEQTRDQAVAALFDRAAKADAAAAIDYRADKAKLGQLDTFLKALAADEANEDQPLQWFLDEAHKRVQVLNGITPTGSKPAVDPAKAKADALAKRRPDTSGLDASLAHVPGGQGAGDVGGEFDDVLSLEGEAFEDALNEMRRRNPQRFARFESSTSM